MRAFITIAVVAVSGCLGRSTMLPLAESGGVAPGRLDWTFGDRGMQIHESPPGRTMWARAAAVDNGRLVVVGTMFDDDGRSDAFVARFQADGGIDATFGGGGIETFASSSWDNAYSVSIELNGDYLVGGDGNGQLWLARFQSGGVLSPGYGADGIAVDAFGANTEMGMHVRVDDGGSIVAGNDPDEGGTGVIKFNGVGNLDTSFGNDVSLGQSDGDGKVIVPSGSAWHESKAIVALGSGRVAVFGGVLGLHRFGISATGALDRTFAGGSVAALPGFDDLEAGFFDAVWTGGGIVALGSAGAPNFDIVLARFDAAGALDPTFGDGGIVQSGNYENDHGAFTILPQSDGRLLVAGSTTAGGQPDGLVMRFETDGRLDTSFGDRGSATIDSSRGSEDRIHALAMQWPRLLAVGHTVIAGRSHLAIWRFNL